MYSSSGAAYLTLPLIYRPWNLEGEQQMVSKLAGKVFKEQSNPDHMSCFYFQERIVKIHRHINGKEYLPCQIIIPRTCFVQL
jgi:hypothetical protein